MWRKVTFGPFLPQTKEQLWFGQTSLFMPLCRSVSFPCNLTYWGEEATEVHEGLWEPMFQSMSACAFVSVLKKVVGDSTGRSILGWWSPVGAALRQRVYSCQSLASVAAWILRTQVLIFLSRLDFFSSMADEILIITLFHFCPKLFSLTEAPVSLCCSPHFYFILTTSPVR